MLDAEAIEALIKALKHKLSDTRHSAAIALGGISGRAIISALTRALDDESSDVRRAAAGSLANSGDKAAIPVLIEALKNTDTYRAAARALGDFGDQRAVLPLIKSLQGENLKDLKFCRSVAASLTRLSRPGKVRHLAKELESEDETVRKEAAGSLMDLVAGQQQGESLSESFGGSHKRRSQRLFKEAVINRLSRANGVSAEGVIKRLTSRPETIWRENITLQKIVKRAREVGFSTEGIADRIKLENTVIEKIARINNMSPDEAIIALGKKVWSRNPTLEVQRVIEGSFFDLSEARD